MLPVVWPTILSKSRAGRGRTTVFQSFSRTLILGAESGKVSGPDRRVKECMLRPRAIARLRAALLGTPRGPAAWSSPSTTLSQSEESTFAHDRYAGRVLIPQNRPCYGAALFMKTTKSQALFEAAQQVIPGGVNSPVRAFRSVGGQPRFIARAKGA